MYLLVREAVAPEPLLRCTTILKQYQKLEWKIQGQLPPLSD
jgi:hypothetical protein